MATAIGTRTLTQDGSIIHIFTSSGTFIPQFTGNVEVLVVAGGGGGGMDMGGGGGGGGVLTSTTFAVTSGTPVTVTVGAGGAGAPGGGENGQPGGHQFTIAATNGGNSVIGALTAIGGGKGGSSYFAYAPDNGTGGNGGSGGGASGYSDGNTGRAGTGTAGQGNNGGGNVGQYYAGGGGGAGAAGGSGTGANAAVGGAGILNSILGVDYYWGGGGGGGSYSNTGGSGGIGGGGSSGTTNAAGGAGFNPGGPGGNGALYNQSNRPGGNGGQNTGGGGGGGSHYARNNRGGNGGSGVVIIKYPATFGKTSTGGNIVNNSELTLHYDMSNTEKSWKGKPTTNYMSNAAAFTGWTSYYRTLQRTSFTTDFGTTGWRFINQPSWSGLYIGYTVPSTGTYTFSAYYKYLSGSSANNGGTVYVSGWGGSDSQVSVNKNLVDVWQRVQMTLNLTNLSGTFYLISYGGTDSGTTSPDYTSFEVTMPMIEAGSFATPFVDGSRSNTQAIVDLSGKTTVTANTLTYTSNNTFSFDGATTYISFTNPITPSQPYTVIQWARPSTALVAGSGGTNPSGVNRRTPLVGPGPVWNPGIWVTSDNIRVHSNTDYRDLAITWTDTTYRMIGQTFNGSQSRIIYNGLVYAGASVGYSPSSPASILVGAETTTGSAINWLGDIPVTMFFKRVLTDSEIKQIFNAFRGRFGV